MKKKIILFFMIFILNAILFMNFVFAAKLGISPAKIEFNINAGEESCKKISVFSDYNGFIIGKDKWSLKDSKNLNEYNLNSKDFVITLNYEERIMIKERKEVEICLIGKKPGKYYGALLFNTENSSAGVGVWIVVNVNGSVVEEEVFENNFIKLTKSIVNEKNSDIPEKYKFLAVSEMIFLFMILIVLSRYNKNSFKKPFKKTF